MKKVIVITGAGSGLGRALALQFGKQGYQVVATDVGGESAAETATLVGASDGQAIAARCDVTSDGDMEQLRELVLSKFGRVDILVNNAGGAALGRLENISWEDWDWMIELNLKGVIRGCRTFIPQMRLQKQGHIVNIASAAAFGSVPGASPYNVTKAGVVSLSETLRGELFRDGIGVSVVMPTYFKTSLTQSFRATSPATLAKARSTTEKAMNRATFTAEDVAKAVDKGIQKNSLYIVPDAQAKLGYFMKRLAPQMFLGMVAKGTPKLE